MKCVMADFDSKCLNHVTSAQSICTVMQYELVKSGKPNTHWCNFSFTSPVWHQIACEYENSLYNMKTTYFQGTWTVMMGFPAVHCMLLTPYHVQKVSIVGNSVIWLDKNQLTLRDGLIICFGVWGFVL